VNFTLQDIFRWT